MGGCRIDFTARGVDRRGQSLSHTQRFARCSGGDLSVGLPSVTAVRAASFILQSKVDIRRAAPSRTLAQGIAAIDPLPDVPGWQPFAFLAARPARASIRRRAAAGWRNLLRMENGLFCQSCFAVRTRVAGGVIRWKRGRVMPDQQPQPDAWQARTSGWSAGRAAGPNGPAVPNRGRPGHSGQLNPGGEEWAQHPAGATEATETA